MKWESLSPERLAEIQRVPEIDTAALEAARSVEEILAAAGGGEWRVSAGHVGDRMHVQPANGLRTANWMWRRGGVLFRSGRQMYPRTPKQLARAVDACQRWCDRENAKEARGIALAQGFGGSGQ